MTTRVDSTWLRRLARSLPVWLLIWHGCAGFEVYVTAPNDPDYNMQFTYFDFTGVTEIVSLSSPVPHLIVADTSGSAKNRIAISGSLPPCDVSIVIIGKMPDGTLVRIPGTINQVKIDPDDVKQAGVVKGPADKVKDLINDLKGSYNPQVVSNTPTAPPGTTEVAIVLRDKITGNIIPQEETREILKNKVTATSSGQTPVKPDCFATCKDDCKAILVVDTASPGTVQTAVIPRQDATAYAGMPTKWEIKCGKDAFTGVPTACGPLTCANGGTCSATGPTGTTSSLCNCPTDKFYGPRCQELTRSYRSTGPGSVIETDHAMPRGNDGASPEAFAFSFEVVGSCTKAGSGGLCTIVSLIAGAKELLKVELGRVPDPYYTSASLPASPPRPQKMTLSSDRYVQNKRWMVVTVSAQISSPSQNAKVLKATTVFCSKEETSSCIERTASNPITTDLSLAGAKLKLGGEFNGCVRHVRLNGQLVDLKPSSISGDATLTGPTCDDQTESCTVGSSRICGHKSMCYGQLGKKLFNDITCSCRCMDSMRMPTEKITTPTKCAKDCSQDTQIISTGPSATLSWAMESGGNIALDPLAPFSVEFRFRTRQDNVPVLLKANLATSPSAMPLEIKIQSGVLSCCYDSNCMGFVPLPVDDGVWHVVFVSLAKSLLVARVDEQGKTYSVAARNVPGVSVVEMNLPLSCIRDVRVANIYLPASVSETTQDSSAATVKVTTGGDVRTGATCADPTPNACATNCDGVTEICDAQRSWGGAACRCKPGHKRYTAGGACQAPPADNPCTRLSITCPNGGACAQGLSGKWHVCK